MHSKKARHWQTVVYPDRFKFYIRAIIVLDFHMSIISTRSFSFSCQRTEGPSFSHRYNNSRRIPNSSEISLALPLSKESSTAFWVNSRSYFCLYYVIMANYYIYFSLTCRPVYRGRFTKLCA